MSDDIEIQFRGGYPEEVAFGVHAPSKVEDISLRLESPVTYLLA